MPMNFEAMSQETLARWMGARVKHGAYMNRQETPEHYVWRAMIQRCTSGLPKYRYWRGIKICKRWQKYENFLSDMGPRPSPKHSLDRYPNPFGGYKPSNCRWATQTEQMRNRRTTVYYVQAGVAKPLSAWAEVFGISTALARYRWRAWGGFVKGKKWHIHQSIGKK